MPVREDATMHFSSTSWLSSAHQIDESMLPTYVKLVLDIALQAHVITEFMS